MSEILVSFENKKETIANWVAALSEVPIDNIAGIEEWGKLDYPAAFLSKIGERSVHRPVRVSEEIDGDLKSVTYVSKQVRVDIIFVTRDRGDYSDVDPEDYVDAEYYVNGLVGRLYDPEGSIELLSINGLSLQLHGPIRKRDEQYEDGWLRRQEVEIAFGYVQQTAEDQHEIESVENIKSVSTFLCPDNADPDCSPHEVTLTVTYVKSVDEKTGVVDLSADYAALDSEGKILKEQALLPEVFSAASEVEQLALEVKQGDLCLRTDETKTYVARNGDNASMADWAELLFTGGGGGGGPSVSIEESTTGSALDVHANKFIRFTNDLADITFTIENDGTFGVTHPVDTEMFFYREGTEEVTIGKGGIVTFEGVLGDNPFKLDGIKNTLVQVKKLDVNRWIYLGGVKSV